MKSLAGSYGLFIELTSRICAYSMLSLINRDDEKSVKTSRIHPVEDGDAWVESNRCVSGGQGNLFSCARSNRNGLKMIADVVVSDMDRIAPSTSSAVMDSLPSPTSIT